MGTKISSTNAKVTVSTEDHVSAVNGNRGSAKFGGFTFYQGIVTKTDYTTRRLTVEVNGTEIANCIHISGCIASLLGVASTQLPPPGANVLCMFSSMQTFVLGVQPAHQTNTELFPNLATTSSDEFRAANLFPVVAEDGDDSNGWQQPGYPLSNDILPGEEELGNNMAVTIRFLSNILQLDAGGLAVLEQCIMNDMIRMVSQYFVHHNCGGDTLIWNNGRCNYEDHFTSYPHEAAGQKDAHDPIAETSDLGQGVYELKEDDDPYDATGRWRKSTYIGFLGDMIHHWITNPTEVVSTYAEGAARAGQFRTWVGADGTLMVQAAGDIMIETTSYMVIPQILHKWDNPELNKDDVLKELNNEYLKLWGKGKKEEYWKDMNASVWQMRQYLRYVTIWHSLSRFRQLQDKDYCVIPTEKDSKVGNKWADEDDKKAAGIEIEDPVPYRTVFRCSPDGSISMVASGAYGISSVVLNQGNIQLSAANNIEIKAGGTVSVTGNDVSAKAYRTLELVSLCGSIVQRARTAWKALCEAGRVWLKGDMPKDGYKAVEMAVPAEFKEYSVIIDSSQGKTLVHGHEGAVMGSTAPAAKCTVEALNGGSANIYGTNISMVAEQDMMTHSMYLGMSASATGFNSDIINFNNWAKLTMAAFDVQPRIRTTMVTTTGMIYAEKGYIGNSIFNGKYKEKMKDAGPVSLKKEDSSLDAKNKAGALKSDDVKDDYPSTEFSDQTWGLFAWSPSGDFEDPNSLKMDYWTDAFTINNEFSDHSAFKHWTSSTSTTPAPRTDSSTCPWPGAGASIFAFNKPTAGLTGTMEEDFKKEDLYSSDDMEPQAMYYVFNNSK